MKRMFGQSLKKRGQIFGRIDFNHGELSNSRIVATEILKTAGEPNARVTAAASVIVLRLFLQLAQQNPCCKSM